MVARLPEYRYPNTPPPLACHPSFTGITQTNHIKNNCLLTVQSVERVATVAAGPELPELAPGTPKFILQQVKDMERLLCRIEKEDSYDMFRIARDPMDKLKGTGEYQQNEGNGDAAGDPGAASEWLTPVRGRDSSLGGAGVASSGRGLMAAKSGQQQEAGANGVSKRDSPASNKKRTSASITDGDDTSSSGGGGGGGGRGQPSHKRPRKGAAAAIVAEGAMEAGEKKEGAKAEQQATVEGDNAPLPDMEKKESEALGAATTPPINLPQIRERFVRGYYVPAPGSYLILSEEPAYGEANTTAVASSEPDATAAAASASTTKNRGTAAGAAGATAAKRPQKKASISRSRSTCPPLPVKEGATTAVTVTVKTPPAAGAAPNTAATTSSSSSSSTGDDPTTTPPSNEGRPVEAEKKQKDAAVLDLTRDSGRLGEEAKLTFEYEPLLDWAGLRADVAGVVSRMLKGADDWLAEKEKERIQRRQRRRRRRCRGGSGGGSGDDSVGGQKEEGEEGDEDDEEDEDAGVQDYLERARRFSATADDFVMKQIERAEKDVRTRICTMC